LKKADRNIELEVTEGKEMTSSQMNELIRILGIWLIRDYESSRKDTSDEEDSSIGIDGSIDKVR
jgi:hypothetical protein